MPLKLDVSKNSIIHYKKTRINSLPIMMYQSIESKAISKASRQINDVNPFVPESISNKLQENYSHHSSHLEYFNNFLQKQIFNQCFLSS